MSFKKYYSELLTRNQETVPTMAEAQQDYRQATLVLLTAALF